MPYFTRDTLQAYAVIRRFDASAQKNLNKTATAARQVSVFLSHSHADLTQADRQDLENVRVLLAAQNVDVYIDSRDPNMPAITSPVTADRIRNKIRECDRFVVLATDRAVQSRWVPWELGYADGKKRSTMIAVLPLASSNEAWPKNEYFGLYPRIERGTDGQATVSVPAETTPRSLTSWLLSG